MHFQLCVSIMAWLMFVTLKNVAVVSLSKPSVALLIADSPYQQAFHCRNMMNENVFVLNFVTKRIMLGVDMLQLLEHCGIHDGCSQFDSAAVLIKDLTMKMQRCCLQSTSSLPFHFLNQFHKSKKRHYLYHHDTRLVASLLIEKAQKRKMGEWKKVSARMCNNNNTSLYTIHFIQL